MTQPYFAEGTEAMVELEAMVDKVGLRNVMYALAHICSAKADHLESNWQDKASAKVWDKQARFFDDHASTILFGDD